MTPGPPPFRPMKAVYCYAYPEVRQLLHAVERQVPDALYLVTTPADRVETLLAPLYTPALKIPATFNGCVDLDAIHEPIIDRILQAYEGHIVGLDGFPFRYPTSGSSEGLFHLLAHLRTRSVERLYVLDGEYEGYAIQADNLGLRVEVVAPDDEGTLPPLAPGIWFLSNPSARDGNIVAQSLLDQLFEGGHRVILDLAYVGATAPHVFDASHPSVMGVVLSFSKPYGVFRSRVGGFTFTREAVPSLFGNKWFKDILRLLQALKLAETVGPPMLHTRYAPVQLAILREIEGQHGLSLRPSDSLLLAHLTRHDAARLDPALGALIAPFERGAGYRFCLTPYFETRCG